MTKEEKEKYQVQLLKVQKAIASVAAQVQQVSTKLSQLQGAESTLKALLEEKDVVVEQPGDPSGLTKEAVERSKPAEIKK